MKNKSVVDRWHAGSRPSTVFVCPTLISPWPFDGRCAIIRERKGGHA